MASKRRSKRRFIQLWSNVKRSVEYHSLSASARAALIELLDKYTGINNGLLPMGCRELADRLNCSKDTANCALRELDDSGLARPTRLGRWRKQQATEWRLTFYRCDKTGELPISNWTTRPIPDFYELPQSDFRDTAVRSEGHETVSRPTTGTRKRKSSMNGKAPSPTTGTHIHLHHHVPKVGVGASSRFKRR